MSHGSIWRYVWVISLILRCLVNHVCENGKSHHKLYLLYAELLTSGTSCTIVVPDQVGRKPIAGAFNVQQLKEVLELMEPKSGSRAPSDVSKLIQLVNRSVSRLVLALGLEKASLVLAQTKVSRLQQSLYLCKVHVSFMSQDRTDTSILPRGSSISGSGASSVGCVGSICSSGGERSGSSSFRNSSAGGVSTCSGSGTGGSTSGSGDGGSSGDHGCSSSQVTCLTISELVTGSCISSSNSI